MLSIQLYLAHVARKKPKTLTLVSGNFRFIGVDFIAAGGFLLIKHIGFRKF